MKKSATILAAICFSALSCTNKKIMRANENTSASVFPKGEKIANANFTGTVWLHMLVNTNTTFKINAGNVTFEPGARTNWHYHPGGQVLLVTIGKGRYQEEGKPVKKITKRGGNKMRT